MDPNLIVFVLWLPFIFLLSIYGTIYCIRGYKKGLYRSLVSVGATVVSGIISAILAKFFASGIADNVYKSIMAENIGNSNPLFADFIELFAKGVLQGFIALFLFSSILFLLTIIFKIIASAIVKDKFEPENKGMRWAGLGVRLVEAIVFTLLLLLPIYGTLATYMPVAEEIIDMSTTSDDEGEEMIVSDIIGKIGNHPLLKAAKTKTMEAIYNTLADSKVENSNLNLPKMISSISGVLEQLKGIENLPEEEQKSAVQSLINYIDENLVGQEWFYDVYSLTINELVKMYNSSMGDLSGEEKVFAEEFIASLDLSEKDFQSCSKESLDFVEYIIENDLLTKMEQEDLSVLYNDECLYRFGEWLNCNESMISFKKMLIMSSLNEFTGSAENSLKLLSKVNLKIHTDKEVQKQEAGATLVLLKGVQKLVVAEGLVRHPDFGYDIVKEYITPYDFASLLYHSDVEDTSNPVIVFLNENPSIVSSLMEVLKQYATMPLTDAYYVNYANNYIREQTQDLDLGGGYMGGDVVSQEFSFSAVDGNGNVYYNGEMFSGGNGGIFSAVMGN